MGKSASTSMKFHHSTAIQPINVSPTISVQLVFSCTIWLQELATLSESGLLRIEEVGLGPQKFHSKPLNAPLLNKLPKPESSLPGRLKHIWFGRRLHKMSTTLTNSAANTLQVEHKFTSNANFLPIARVIQICCVVNNFHLAHLNKSPIAAESTSWNLNNLTTSK